VSVVGGPHKDSSHPLPLTSALIVGRKRHHVKNQAYLQLATDEEVSSTHCLIRALADGEVRVEDLGSLNGTRVGTFNKKVVWREELGKDESCSIAAGDCIEVGGSILLLEHDHQASSKVYTGNRRASLKGSSVVRFLQTPGGGSNGETPGHHGGPARGAAATTGARTVNKRRSKSPSVETPYIMTTFAEPPSPIPINFDVPLQPSYAEPSKTITMHFSWSRTMIISVGLVVLGMLSLFSHMHSAQEIQHRVNLASISAGASIIDVQACEEPSQSWFRSTDKVIAVSKQTAAWALSDNLTDGHCFWSPTPWALLQLKLSHCALPMQLRLSVLINEKHPTSSYKMIPELVDVKSGDGHLWGHFLVKDNVLVTDDVATAAFYFDRKNKSSSSCVSVLHFNFSSQIDSKHGACVHRIELFA